MTAALLASTALAQAAAAEAANARNASAGVEAVTVTPAQGGTTGVGTVQVRGAPVAAGSMIPEEQPKNRTTVTSEQLQLRTPSVSPFQGLNFAPGVNASGDDSTGSAAGNIRVRGFRSDQLSLTINGVQLNDLGNSAVFPLQQPDAEVLQELFIVQGSSDVDTPSAVSSGGQIGQIVRFPSKEFGMRFSATGGASRYGRVSGMIDTGELLPGLTAFAQISDLRRDLFRGVNGQQDRLQANARVRYDIGTSSFVSLYGSYTKGEIDTYAAFTKQTYDTYGYWGEESCGWRGTTPARAGGAPIINVAQNETTGNVGPQCANATLNAFNTNTLPAGATATATGGISAFPTLSLNPFRVGWITGNSSFQLTDTVRLDVTPSYYYVLATGGSQAQSILENDVRLRATLATATSNTSGTDLNGDGDTLDTVIVYNSSITRTDRSAVNAKLNWDFYEDHKLILGGVYDYGRHRQTGPANFLPGGWFAGAFLPGQTAGVDYRYDRNQPFFARRFNPTPGLVSLATPTANVGYVPTAFASIINKFNGTQLRSRDRMALNTFEQWSIEYRGEFFEDALKVSVGIREPKYSRDAFNYCWIGGATPFGANVPPTTFGTFAGDNQFLAGVGGTLCSGQSITLNRKAEYKETLPYGGLNFYLTPEHQFYASYSKSMRAPDVDASLYTTLPNPRLVPELSESIEGGYRFQSDWLLANVSVFNIEIDNFLLTTLNADSSANQQTNIGRVEKHGAELEVGAKFLDFFGVYASGSYTNSETKDNLPFGCTVVVPFGTACPAANLAFLPNAGKKELDTPEWMSSLVAQYDDGSLFGQVSAKYTGKRYANLMNDEAMPAHTVVDLAVGYRFDFFSRPTLRLFVNNLFNEKYLSRLANGGTGTAGFRSSWAATPLVLASGAPAGINGGSTGAATYNSGEGQFFGLELTANF